MPNENSASFGSRPNILIVNCHDLGRHVGCLGAPIETPQMDALAGDGVLFTNHFCTAASCSPSRGSIMTGRYPHNNGLIGLAHIGWEVGAQEVTLPMYLNAAGYSTHIFGVQHEHNEAARLGYRHIDESRRDACGATELLINFLEQVRQPGDKSFFVSTGFGEPHRPYGREGYDNDDPDKVTPLPYLPDKPGIREDIAGLHGLIYRVDECVGEIVEALDRTGLAENTVLIFTTDHGIAMPRAKGTCYDPGIGTTLMMRWPGRAGLKTGPSWDGGRRQEELLTNCDLLPTLLDLVGAGTPDCVDGRSFLALLDGGDYQPREDIFAEMTWHDKYNPMRCVRTTTHKYIRNFGDRPLVYIPADIYVAPAGEEVRDEFYATRRPEEELYNLQQDPLEMSNLIDDPDHAEVAERLRRRVADWMVETNDPLLYGDVPPTARQRERLEERQLDN